MFVPTYMDKLSDADAGAAFYMFRMAGHKGNVKAF